MTPPTETLRERILLHLWDMGGVAIDDIEIADALGEVPAIVSRELRHMEAEGLISYETGEETTNA